MSNNLECNNIACKGKPTLPAHLPNISEEDQADFWLTALDTPDVNKRYSVINKIAQTKDRSAIPALLKMYQNKPTKTIAEILLDFGLPDHYLNDYAAGDLELFNPKIDRQPLWLTQKAVENISLLLANVSNVSDKDNALTLVIAVANNNYAPISKDLLLAALNILISPQNIHLALSGIEKANPNRVILTIQYLSSLENFKDFEPVFRSIYNNQNSLWYLFDHNLNMTTKPGVKYYALAALSKVGNPADADIFKQLLDKIDNFGPTPYLPDTRLIMIALDYFNNLGDERYLPLLTSKKNGSNSEFIPTEIRLELQLIIDRISKKKND